MLKSLVCKLPLIRHFLKTHYDIISIRDDIRLIKNRVNRLVDLNRRVIHLNIEDYTKKNLYENPKYDNLKKLNKFEYEVYSQSGEDGIIDEIFNRIGTTNKLFVEFGAQNGMSNNTTYLLLKDWTGAWIEANSKFVEEIKRKFFTLIRKENLILKEAFITAENIETLFKELNIPKHFDLLSIDVDGNDYWVWKAIVNFSPRVVVIEYNAMFKPHDKWVMKYNPDHVWNASSYQGSSLKSLEILGLTKKYKLVGCNFIGVNAFFVREDLVTDKFLEPFTAENHYEPLRYYLFRRTGHPRDFGDFENI